MEQKKYNKVRNELFNALTDGKYGFRGFLIDGVDRLEVPDEAENFTDTLHAFVAKQELEKNPEFKYESGMDTIAELMKEKNAIYITHILNKDEKGNVKSVAQKAVAYMRENYEDVVEYMGRKMHAYEMLRCIAIGLGYDVDEYYKIKDADKTNKMPYDADHYEGKISVKVSRANTRAIHKLPEGAKPIVTKDDQLIGFFFKGKFYSKEHFSRYSSLNQSNADPDPEENR